MPAAAGLPCPHAVVSWLWLAAAFPALSGQRPRRPFARPLLELARHWYGLRPSVVRLDAGYWGLRLIAWIHTALGAIAVVPWNPKRQKNRTCLPPTWTAEELGKRSSIERFFGPVFSLV